MKDLQTKKALVLFSGGLDSRIVAKMMEEQGFKIHLGFVKLPFETGCANGTESMIEFAKEQNYEYIILDATKGELMRRYIDIVKNPDYGRGSAMNPCKDCKIFIFIEGAKLMKEIDADILVTGEVLGQRPMSQMKKALMFDEEIAGLTGKILRPLSAKLLDETEYEKIGLVDRSKLLGIQGRQRHIQIKMAEEYKISYPTPAGGCLLCEKDYGKKLKVLFEYYENPNYQQILLLKGGRMFKQNGLIFAGRNETENLLLEKLSEELDWNLIMDAKIAGPYVIFDKEEDRETSKKIREAFMGKNIDKRKEFDLIKI